ncbi:MFS transporter [Nocardioides sp. KR10-350]|uniref:MFS transporter n=1 Tax=Nocardioides cheoyonin TaxID=3156615 RepID=UPI0032B3F084
MDADTSTEAAKTARRGRLWYADMSPNERRTFWACFGGWATDAFDVQMFSLVLTVLLSTGFLASNGEAGTIATITLVSSAFGGWVAGLLADRFGRITMLKVSVCWFAVFACACGFAQDDLQLGGLRALMGLGFGGEWAVGAVLMAETVRAGIRGRAVGGVQAAWSVGWGAAVVLYVVVSDGVSDDWLWRIMFWAGLLPALLVLYIRRHVEEPPLARRTAGPRPGLAGVLQIFHPEFLGRTVLCSLIAVGAQGGYYALTTWLPQFLEEERGLEVLALGGTLAVVIVGAFVGYLLGADLSDRLGRRWTLVVTSILALAISLVFTLLHPSTAVFTVLCFPLGMFSAAYFSSLGPLFSEQYPTRIRASGQGFCYNFGRGIGALFPSAIGFLSDRIEVGTAIAVFAGSAYALLAICALVVRERDDVDIDTVDEALA